MNLPLFLLLTLTLSSSLLSLAATSDVSFKGDPGGQSELTQICGHSPDAEECLLTVRSVSPGLDLTDAGTVMRFLTEATLRNAKDAKEEADSMASDHDTQEDTKRVLNDCASTYAAATYSAREALKALSQKPVDEHRVISNLTSVEAATKKCSHEDLSEYAVDMQKDISNAVSIFKKYWRIEKESYSRIARAAMEAKLPTPPPSCPQPAVSPLDQAALAAICAKARDPKLCETIANNAAMDTNYLGPTNDIMVLALLVDHVMNETAMAVDSIKETMEDPNPHKAARVIMGTCIGHYENGFFELFTAMMEVDKRNVSKEKVNGDSVKCNLADATKDYKECQALFDRAKMKMILQDIQKSLETNLANAEALAKSIWP